MGNEGGVLARGISSLSSSLTFVFLRKRLFTLPIGVGVLGTVDEPARMKSLLMLEPGSMIGSEIPGCPVEGEKLEAGSSDRRRAPRAHTTRIVPRTPARRPGKKPASTAVAGKGLLAGAAAGVVLVVESAGAGAEVDVGVVMGTNDVGTDVLPDAELEPATFWSMSMHPVPVHL
jgi:hypothetical protein